MAICEVHRKKLTNNSGTDEMPLIICPADYCYYGNLSKGSCECRTINYCNTEGIVSRGGKIPQAYINYLEDKVKKLDKINTSKEKKVLFNLLKIANSTKHL